MLVSQTTNDVANRVQIEFHDVGVRSVNWKSAFQVRSAYRNEADFRIEQLRAIGPDDGGLHIARIVDPDRSVSKNYEHIKSVSRGLFEQIRNNLRIAESREQSCRVCVTVPGAGTCPNTHCV